MNQNHDTDLKQPCDLKDLLASRPEPQPDLGFHFWFSKHLQCNTAVICLRSTLRSRTCADATATITAYFWVVNERVAGAGIWRQGARRDVLEALDDGLEGVGSGAREGWGTLVPPFADSSVTWPRRL